MKKMNWLTTSCLCAAMAALYAMPAAVWADAPAKLVEQTAPEYPDRAYDRKLEGWVELEFLVDSSGAVKNISIIQSEPERIFDSAAVKAVRQWKFEPAERAGAPVESQERRRLVFKL